MASLGGHILVRLAGATYGQSRVTHFGLPGQLNTWLVFSGDPFLAALWLISGDIFGCLAGASYDQSWGDNFLAAWRA